MGQVSSNDTMYIHTIIPKFDENGNFIGVGKSDVAIPIDISKPRATFSDRLLGDNNMLYPPYTEDSMVKPGLDDFGSKSDGPYVHFERLSF